MKAVVTIFKNWFGAIELHSMETAQPMATTSGSSSFTQVLSEVRSNKNLTLDELSHRSPVLVVFLRHAGCTFCREALADLQQQRQQIAANGCSLAIVHLSNDAAMAKLIANYQLDDVPRFADADLRLYRAFGLSRGTLWQLLGPHVWFPGAKAFFSGHGLGMIDGDGFQMPGAFVIHHGKIVKAFRHASPADRPNYAELSQAALMSK
jgi:peroxiredoxin